MKTRRLTQADKEAAQQLEVRLGEEDEEDLTSKDEYHRTAEEIIKNCVNEMVRI